jgi:hypothetical protein
VNAYTLTTSIFLRRDVQLRPAAETQPSPGIGAIIRFAD